MSYTDAATFAKYAGKLQTWDVPTLGTSFLVFNLDKGPFTDQRLRQAAAHATDHDAIHHAVFYGRGDVAKGFYAPASSWHTAEARSWPTYDPDKARALLRQANAVGLQCSQAEDAYPYLKQTGELLQAMWSEVGFKVKLDVLSAPILRQAPRPGIPRRLNGCQLSF